MSRQFDLQTQSKFPKRWMLSEDHTNLETTVYESGFYERAKYVILSSDRRVGHSSSTVS